MNSSKGHLGRSRCVRDSGEHARDVLSSIEDDQGDLCIPPRQVREDLVDRGDYVLRSGVGKRGSCHLFRHTMATLMLEGGSEDASAALPEPEHEQLLLSLAAEAAEED